VSGWLILAGVLGIPYLLAYTVAHWRDRRWRSWAEAAGVTDLVSSSLLWIRTRLTGRIGPLRVSFERYRAADEYGTRVVVDGLGHSSGEFDLRAENVGSAIKKALGARESPSRSCGIRAPAPGRSAQLGDQGARGSAGRGGTRSSPSGRRACSARRG